MVAGKGRCRDRRQRLTLSERQHGGPPIDRGGTQPDVATLCAEPIQGRLSFLDADVVGQGAPPALRGGVVGLLHHALAVAPSWRADRDLDAVVLGDRGEGRGHLAGLGVAHGGHPVEAPLLRQPTQLAGRLVQGVDELGLVLGRSEGAAPLAGVSERTDEQVRVLAPAPRRRRVGELEPVPLGLLTRWVLDRCVRPTLGGRAGLAVRPQIPSADLACEGRIRPVVAKPGDLIEQGHCPQVRVFGEACADVVDERLERVVGGGLPDAGGPLVVEVGADGLAVPVQVPGDRRDRPALPAQCVSVDVFLPCQHGKRGLLR